jgi:serine/threonine protein kinase
VRLACQIAHPERVRRIRHREAHGELYLLMEFVDGEDLSALLKHIGRLPNDKGVEHGGRQAPVLGTLMAS